MIEQSPILRETDAYKNAYRGFAMAQMRILKDYMQLAGLNTYSRVVTFADGVVITCKKSFNHEVVDIFIPPVVSKVSKDIKVSMSCFAVHPRSSIYPNGIDAGVITEGTFGQSSNNNVMFPLYDKDKGTFRIYEGVDKWLSKPSSTDNYGVNHWVAKDRTIGWRGWPAITLGNSRETSIDGVTQFDVQTGYNTYYTPLSGNLYIDGTAISVPGKVRGAGRSAHGSTVLVVTVNYTQYDISGIGDATINPDGQDWLYDNNSTELPEEMRAGRVGGYYDELYIRSATGVPYLVNGRKRYALTGYKNKNGIAVDGWIRIGYRVSSVTNLPVWFSADALSAEEESGTWSWTYATTPDPDITNAQGVFTSSFSTRPTVNNTFVLQTSPNIAQFTIQLNAWDIAYMLNNHASITQSRYDETSVAVNYISKSKMVPHLLERRPDPVNYYIDITSLGGGLYRLTATGFKFRIGSWNTGSTELSIIVDTSTICGVNTFTFKDQCGFEASVKIRGNYEFVLTESYESPCWNAYHENGWWAYYQNPEYDSLGNLIKHETWALSNQQDDTAACDGGQTLCNSACTPYYGRTYISSTAKQCQDGTTIMCSSYTIIYVKYVYMAVC